MKGKVVNLYKYDGKGGTVAFFDIIVDDTLVLKGSTLKKSAAGEYYWKPPAKPRMKNKVQVQDAEGHGVWDEHYRLVYDEKKPSKNAAAFNQDVLGQAVAAFDGNAEAGRGASTAAPRTRSTASAARTEDAIDAGGADDDLPF